MKLDPIAISVVALGVSIFSLILSSFRAGVDRKVQWEQMRGNTQARILTRGIEILTMIEEVRRFPTDEGISLIQKLVRIGEGVVKVRESLKEMVSPPSLMTSALITKFAPIKSNLDETEPFFEELWDAIRKSDFRRASKVADALILIFYGSPVMSNQDKVH